MYVTTVPAIAEFLYPHHCDQRHPNVGNEVHVPQQNSASVVVGH